MQWLLDIIEKLSASEWAAWWGAIVASIVALSQYIAWKHSRANLKVDVIHDTQKEKMTIRISNIGDSDTTITEILFRHKRYGSEPFDLWMFSEDESKPIQLPKKLSAGEVFEFNLRSTIFSSGKYLVEVSHSKSNKVRKEKLYS